MKVTISVAGTFHAFRLAEQLDRRGYLVRLLTTHRPFRHEQIASRRIVTNPVPEILMRGPRKLGFHWSAGDYLKSVMFDRWASTRVGECDILVAWAGAALKTLRVARSRGARTILERGSAHVRTQWRILTEEYRRWRDEDPALDPRVLDLQLREYEEADFISVPSRFALSSFLAEGVPATRLLHIPYGVDLSSFSPGESPGRPFRVLAVGLGLRKGTQYLLEALSRLGRRDVEAWLVGAAPSDIVPLLRCAPECVKWWGPVAHGKLPALYRRASVFVLPSLEEGLSLAMLEALACGVPIVATPNTGAVDVITDGVEGRIVPPRDSEALRRVLMELYEDEPRRCAMARAAACTAQAWGWDRYGDRVVSAYQRILRSGDAERSAP